MDLQGMVPYFEIQDFAGGFSDLLDAWVAELLYLTTGPADQMVVLSKGMCFFKLGLCAHETMSAYQVAADQKVHGVVTGCAAHAVILQFHPGVEPLDVEMPFMGIDFIQYCEAFGCFSVPVQFEVLAEYALDIGSLFRHHHGANVRVHAGPGMRKK